MLLLIYWGGLARAKAKARARARRRAIVKKRGRTGHLSRRRLKAHVLHVRLICVYSIGGIEDIGEMIILHRPQIGRASVKY